MIKSIAVIVTPNINGWFQIAAKDENDTKHVLYEGPDLGRALTYAACNLGAHLVIPMSGPETTF